MITKLEVGNLTAFNELAIKFSPNVNIIIGENSTGKTLVLKTLYAATKIKQLIDRPAEVRKPEHSTIWRVLHDVFDPKCSPKDFFQSTLIQEAILSIELNNSDHFSFQVSENSDTKILKRCETTYPETTFIPSKEMMFFLPDLLDMVNRFEVRVDQIHSRIISAMTRPKLKQKYLNPVSQSVIDKIEGLLGGKFIVDNDLSIQFLENGQKRPADMMAEGFRKFGVLSRLLESGEIIPGKSGPLLWDEPEINLNPKLIKSLVEILIELSNAGLQIILVTHNFMLLKWFELLTNRGKDGVITYHNLYCDADSSEIKVCSSNVYNEIKSNSMEDAFDSLVSHELNCVMGEIDAEKN